MSRIRVLVGTRKGAFILTSGAARRDWQVRGPHFDGWEIFHIAGSPANPDRLYASQSSSWFGQVIQRSDDGGATWNPVGNEFNYVGDPRYASVLRRHAQTLGIQARVASGCLHQSTRTRSTPGLRMPHCFVRPTAG